MGLYVSGMGAFLKYHIMIATRGNIKKIILRIRTASLHDWIYYSTLSDFFTPSVSRLLLVAYKYNLLMMMMMMMMVIWHNDTHRDRNVLWKLVTDRRRCRKSSLWCWVNTRSLPCRPGCCRLRSSCEQKEWRTCHRGWYERRAGSRDSTANPAT